MDNLKYEGRQRLGGKVNKRDIFQKYGFDDNYMVKMLQFSIEKINNEKLNKQKCLCLG